MAFLRVNAKAVGKKIISRKVIEAIEKFDGFIDCFDGDACVYWGREDENIEEKEEGLYDHNTDEIVLKKEDYPAFLDSSDDVCYYRAMEQALEVYQMYLGLVTFLGEEDTEEYDSPFINCFNYAPSIVETTQIIAEITHYLETGKQDFTIDFIYA